MRNYQNYKLPIFTLIIFFFNCSKKEPDNYIKKINSKVLFSSTSESNELLNGGNYYYNKNGDLLTDILYLENNDSVLHYQMTVRNSKKQIVYFCEYYNGLITREFDFFKFEKITLENGTFLYENYCKNCHLSSTDFIGTSLSKMIRLNKKTLINKYNTEVTHDTLPKLTKKQILSIVEYIEK